MHPGSRIARKRLIPYWMDATPGMYLPNLLVQQKSNLVSFRMKICSVTKWALQLSQIYMYYDMVVHFRKGHTRMKRWGNLFNIEC